MRAIIDSDILIDYFRGLEMARRELRLYPRREVSVISWMEIMVGADTPQEEAACQEFFVGSVVHPLSADIAAEAVKVRKKFRLRLPDAIVWATARVNNCLLITRNRKDFPAREPGVRFPYSLRNKT